MSMPSARVPGITTTRNSLDDAARNFDFLRFKSQREFDLSTHISLKHRYVYFQVGKAASSTVKYHLQRLELIGTNRRIVNVNDRTVSPHIWPSQLPSELLLSILNDRNFRKIAFVRNPYARILSCYLHRIIRDPDSPSNRALKAATGGKGGNDVSFSEFVEIICSQESLDQEMHWRCQYDEILADLIRDWDFIGRVERLDEDLQKMLLLVSGGADDDLGSGVNASPATTSADTKLFEYYTAKIQENVARRYHADFDYFGYSRELGSTSMEAAK